MYDVLVNAKNENIIVITSAGNIPPNSAPKIMYPQQFVDIVTCVGSYHIDGNLSSTSNYGCESCAIPVPNFVDITAPGYAVLTTDLNNSYDYLFSGTSAAAPIVAGVVALAKGYVPDLPVDSISKWLKETADTTFLTGDYTPEYGAGRVDAEAFIQKVVDNSCPYNCGFRGDINCDKIINVSDVIYMMHLMLGNIDSTSECWDEKVFSTDLNCDNKFLTISDLQFIINIFVFGWQECPSIPDKNINYLTQDSLGVSSGFCVIGEQNVKIEVELKNSTNIAGFQARYVYDPNILTPVFDSIATDSTYIKYLPVGVATNYKSSGSIVAIVPSQGIIEVYFYSNLYQTANIPANAGSVLELYFDISPIASPCVTSITPVDLGYKINDLATPEGISITPALYSGTLYVTDYCSYTNGCLNDRGNANNDPDDIANISDLTFIVDLLFNSGLAPACEKEADVDVSGDIGISDVTYFVDYIFNGGSALPPCQ
ncbi:MAG: hypothetical protein DRP35_05880 [Candidatus Zixiibacteriota bacterium]|nr:MAG: hypothetical protein DRP35_05880 [candidate division Zixibacteria bacterium]